MLHYDRASATPQCGVAIAIRKVQHETDHQLPTEPNPSKARQALHHEYAQQRANDADDVHERHAEWSFPLWIGVAQHDDANAYQREREQGPDVREVVGLAGISDQRPARN